LQNHKTIDIRVLRERGRCRRRNLTLAAEPAGEGQQAGDVCRVKPNGILPAEFERENEGGGGVPPLGERMARPLL
jgi:hypothetical protein